MEAIINLLNQKNQHLKKFFTINKAELLRFADGDFNNLDAFYTLRENILILINHIDTRVEEEVAALGSDAVFSREFKFEAQILFQQKDSLVAQILDQDLQILSMIEDAKNAMIKELQSVQKNKQVIGAYHSGKVKKVIDKEG